jgi:hypothetical protein
VVELPQASYGVPCLQQGMGALLPLVEVGQHDGLLALFLLLSLARSMS